MVLLAVFVTHEATSATVHEAYRTPGWHRPTVVLREPAHVEVGISEFDPTVFDAKAIYATTTEFDTITSTSGRGGPASGMYVTTGSFRFNG